MTQQLPSRRAFLGQAACSAVTATPILSTLLNLRMTNSSLATPVDGDDYKALVCFFFAGGNDSFNTLVPNNGAAYSTYQKSRSNMSLAQNTLLPLNGNHKGQSYGVHPSMPEVQGLYNNQRLAFVSNVGTLVEPVTLATWENGTAKVPAGMFSHSDQIMHWQTSVPDQRAALGWGGRVADLLSACNTSDRISMNISLSGTNTFQSGANSVSYEIEPSGSGAITLAPYAEGEDPTAAALHRTAINSLMDAEYSNLFQRAFAKKHRASLDAAQEFSAAISGQSLITTFSTNRVSESFQMVARTIAARQTLGMRRQTFFVLFGGFDHHDELLNSHAGMMAVVSKALGEFDAAVTELGLQDKVTTFTASDFARTLSSNGKGTDHAWGSNQMIMGGAVKGGQIYGTYPDLTLGSSLDTGRGRLIPTMSTDEYFAELARWFGVSDNDLGTVFPNLNRFHQSPGNAPVGFMR